MANGLILNICLMSVLSRVESCFLPGSLRVAVPRTIQAGYEITKVELEDCDPASMHFTLKDPGFTIRANGVIVASTAVTVAPRGRTFSVWARDDGGSESEMEVHLVHGALQKRDLKVQGLLKRSKRRWSPPPFNILENFHGPYPKEIEKIVSDSEASFDVYYNISGPGVNQHPVEVFALDKFTGMLSVLKEVDREKFPMFTLQIRVFDKKTNKETDKPLNVQLVVDDENDNAPEFIYPLELTVLEHNNPGTVVGKVNATDRDKERTLHVKIKYSLLTGLDLFAINPDTGVITTVTNTLDREVKDKHMVTVKIQDMGGAVNGLANTATATIIVGDINDNPPTFTKASYEVSVKETENEKLILRIPVEDKDLINTPNWITKFVITKGNESGNFRIDADPKTNEGLLYILKPIDYEKNKNIKLEITARNEAELINTKAQWKSIPVDVIVGDVDEGPEFSAPTVRFTVKENTPNGTVIGTYTAVDPETKSSAGIKYYKATDPASWINVDRSTGALRVANTIDRESPFALNGIYNITMKAVDSSSKTGTGTVIIQVEDENDNVPVTPTGELVVCEKEGELGSVVVVAEDRDQSPFSSPFSFSLPPGNDGKWSLTKFNDTSATLKHIKELPTGIYTVPVDVTDLQGYGKTQKLKVRICQCRNGACLPKESSISLGGLALLAMLLPLALLLLLCIPLIFFCVTKGEKLEFEGAGDSGGFLLKSNTEGRGDEVDTSLIPGPLATKESYPGEYGALPGIKPSGTIGTKNQQGNWELTTNLNEFQYNNHYREILGGHDFGSATGFDNRTLFQDSAFLHMWQTNGHYLHQKLTFLGGEEDARYADDILHSYGFEGVGSAAGSVGCCSDYDNDDLDFLNTLGPKFKTLADVCTKT